tara:strand:- start:1275 stop:1889 length:615 start_codon:yes stop_codon:yes gene_type:complete
MVITTYRNTITKKEIRNIKMNKYLIPMVGLMLIVGCAGTKTISKSDVPDWYLNPPKYEGLFVGVGDALRPQMSLSKKVATNRARVEISEAVATEVKSVLKDYMQASGIGSEASALEFTESVSKSLSNKVLNGSIIEKTEIKDGRVFVMVTYDINEVRTIAKETARNAAKKEEALYNEFKARQGFESLDKEFDEMESATSVAAPE